MNAQIISRIKREIRTMKMFCVRAVAGPMYVRMYVYTLQQQQEKEKGRKRENK